MKQETIDKMEPYRHLLGKITDEEYAGLCGVHRKSVGRYRDHCGLSAFGTKLGIGGDALRKDPERHKLPTNVLAERHGLSKSRVRYILRNERRSKDRADEYVSCPLMNKWGRPEGMDDHLRRDT